jgi:hypothetical protein
MAEDFLTAAPHLVDILTDLSRPPIGDDGLIHSDHVNEFLQSTRNLPRHLSVVYKILCQARLHVPAYDEDHVYYLIGTVHAHDDEIFPEDVRPLMTPWMPALKALRMPIPAYFLAKSQAGGDVGSINIAGSLITSKASHQYTFLKYSGALGEAQDFVDKLVTNLEAVRIPKLSWFSHLLQATRGDAHDLVILNKKKFQEDFDLHAQALVHDFDVGKSANVAEEYNRLHQQHNETPVSFKLRLQKLYDTMVKMGNKPDFGHESYDNSIKTDFYWKITKHYRNIIKTEIIRERGKLQHVNDPLTLITFDELLVLASRVDELELTKNKEHHNHRKSSAPSMPNMPSRNCGLRPQKCFYCGSTAHRYEKKTGKSGKTYYYCPEKMAGREPCPEFKTYHRQKYGKEYSQNFKPASPPPSGTPPTAPQTQTTTATVLPNGIVLDRSTAITVDMRFKKANGSYTPANSHETLVDSCGCENLMDARWAKHNLKLPVKVDQTDRARVASTGLAGAKAFFTEYMEVDVLYKGTPMSTRFYLSTDLPRPVLLGKPWLETHSALIDLGTGEVTLRGLLDRRG